MEDTTITLLDPERNVLSTTSLHHLSTFDGMRAFRCFIWRKFSAHWPEESTEDNIRFENVSYCNPMGFVADWPEKTKDYHIDVLGRKFVVHVEWKGVSWEEFSFSEQLTRNWKFFEQHYDEFEKRYGKGRYLVIADEEVKGAYSTNEEAFREAGKYEWPIMPQCGGNIRFPKTVFASFSQGDSQ